MHEGFFGNFNFIVAQNAMLRAISPIYALTVDVRRPVFVTPISDRAMLVGDFLNDLSYTQLVCCAELNDSIAHSDIIPQ